MYESYLRIRTYTPQPAPHFACKIDTYPKSPQIFIREGLTYNQLRPVDIRTENISIKFTVSPLGGGPREVHPTDTSAWMDTLESIGLDANTHICEHPLQKEREYRRTQTMDTFRKLGN